MARYFTSAQLTLFRSALALLEDGIFQGELDVADQKYVDATLGLVSAPEALASGQTDEIQGFESDVAALKSTLSAGKESSKPKAKSIFSWFSKNKQEAAPSADLSRTKVELASAIAEKAIPKVVKPEAAGPGLAWKLLNQPILELPVVFLPDCLGPSKKTRRKWSQPLLLLAHSLRLYCRTVG